MTEIPEHLLRRSQERRQALGLGGGEGGEAPAAAASSTPGTAVAPAAAAAPVAPAPVVEAPPPPPREIPPYVQASLRRRRVPIWAMPVLALLPLWAFFYQASLTPPKVQLTGPLAIGQQVYVARCSSCHLVNGDGDSAGGVGRQLSNGEVLLTFPKLADQVAFVSAGSPPAKGSPFGDPNRPGGQQVSRGGMPAWKGILTDEQLTGVVCYERVTLQGNTTDIPPECAAATP